jgi:membrane-bound lytic murein transglycosylase D
LTLSTLSEDFDNLFIGRNNHLLNMGATSSITKVQIKGGVALRDVASVIDIPVKQLAGLNRQLKLAITPTYLREVDIYIPYTKLANFKTNQKEIKKFKNKLLVHIVKSGDSLYALGRIYGMSYGIIKKFNNLKSNKLRINQKLIIPLPMNSTIKISKI